MKNISVPTLCLRAFLVVSTLPFTQSQTAGNDPTLAVMVLEQPRSEGMVRLWLSLRNSGVVPRIFCRTSWSYMWISGDANGPGFGGTKASLHGCGDADHDAFWLLLPGERRFDSFEVKAPPRGNPDLLVDVDLVERTLNSSVTIERTVSWKGRLSDAVALGEKLRAGRIE